MTALSDMMGGSGMMGMLEEQEGLAGICYTVYANLNVHSKQAWETLLVNCFVWQ